MKLLAANCSDNFGSHKSKPDDNPNSQTVKQASLDYIMTDFGDQAYSKPTTFVCHLEH